MSNLRNRVTLIGNLGTQPEVKSFESGKKKASFALATNDYYKNSEGEKIQDTQWHNIIAWNQQAEWVENYVKKGQEIALEGKLVSRSYEDKAGITRYITEVVLQEILLLRPNTNPKDQ
jgi:single-strand DNA-binding protein